VGGHTGGKRAAGAARGRGRSNASAGGDAGADEEAADEGGGGRKRGFVMQTLGLKMATRRRARRSGTLSVPVLIRFHDPGWP
jgi:hypothetical protein